MNRHGHELSAATLALATVPAATNPLALAGTVAVAMAFSHGRLSPDDDQRVSWIAHRTTTHTLEYVAIASSAAVAACASIGAAWIGWGIALGWGSHLLADALFGGIPSVLLGGRRVVRDCFRRQRIRTRRIGFHLKTGGPAEVAAYGLLPVAIAGLIIIRMMGNFPW